MRYALTALLAIALAATHAQAETYDLDWAEWRENSALYWTFQRTRVQITVTPHPTRPDSTQWFAGGYAWIGPTGSGPGSSAFGEIDHEFTNCRCLGTWKWGWGIGHDFVINMEFGPNGPGYALAGGKKVAAAPPPPPPPPSSSLNVTVTAIAPNGTYSGTVYPHVWHNGPAGTYTYRILVDGTSYGAWTSPVTHRTVPWNTKLVPNGAHKLTLQVTGNGKTGSVAVNVIVKN